MPTTPPQLALMMLVGGISFWIAAIVGTLIPGRSIWSLVSPLGLPLGLAGKSVLLVSSLTIIIAVIPIPGMSHLTPNLEFTGLRLEHALWLMPLLLFTLVQTSGENPFFKGYLHYLIGCGYTHLLDRTLVCGSCVRYPSLPGNPDMKDNLWMIIPMFVVTHELLAIYLLMRSGGMEIPLVLH